MNGHGFDDVPIGWGNTAMSVRDPVTAAHEQGAGPTLSLAWSRTGEASVRVENDTPSYCAGTLIATEHGEVAVEALRVGDLVRTGFGALRPIRWIGRRSYSGRFVGSNRAVLPVTFRAGSLGGGLPRRDLSVSPRHSMVIDGALIPAGLLVNGTTVVQSNAVSSVTYLHIELDSHDILMAEGTPSESFLDDDNRRMFHNATEFARLYPRASRGPARYCLPRVEYGELLDAARQRLSDEWARSIGRLRGSIEGARGDIVHGWVRDADEPGRRVQVIIRAGGVTLGIAVAELWRSDLADAGEGDGWHGFEFRPPGELSAAALNSLEVAVASCRTMLPWARPHRVSSG